MKKLLLSLLFPAFTACAVEIPLQDWKEFDRNNPRPDTVVKAVNGVKITSAKGYTMMYCTLPVPAAGDLRIVFSGNTKNAADARFTAQLRAELYGAPLAAGSCAVQKDGVLLLTVPPSLRGKNAFLLLMFNQSAGELMQLTVSSIDFAAAKTLAVLDDFKAPGPGTWKEFDAANPLPDQVTAGPGGLQLSMQKRTYAVIYRDLLLPAGSNAVSLTWQGDAVPDAKVQFVLRSKSGKTLDDVALAPSGKEQTVLLRTGGTSGEPAVVLIFLHRLGGAFTVTLNRMEAIGI